MITRMPTSLKVAVLTLALTLVATTFSACDINGATLGTDPAVVDVSVYYFQSFYAPNLNQPDYGPPTPLECVSVPDPGDWFALVVATGIHAASSGDFQFNAANFQPLGAGVVAEHDLWTAYLGSYWQPQQLNVPAGTSLDSSQAHQGAFFLLQSVQGTPGTAIPALLQGAVLTPDHSSPTIFSSSDSAQPTNISLADFHTAPLVQAGPC